MTVKPVVFILCSVVVIILGVFGGLVMVTTVACHLSNLVPTGGVR